MKIPFLNNKKNKDTVEISKSLYEALVDVNEPFKSSRAILDPLALGGNSEVKIPYAPMPLQTLYNLSKHSDVLRTIIFNLKKEIFRNGYEIKEKFSKKCSNCGKEFKHDLEICENCGSKNLINPNEIQKKILETYCEKMNDNNQDLLIVHEELNNDLETVDDAYLLAVKDYFFDEDGFFKGHTVVEFIRIDPKFIRIICNNQGLMGRTNDNKKIMTCVEHRNQKYEDLEFCPICKKQLFQVHYVYEGIENEKLYYTNSEIKHTSKYNPSLTYGYSMIYACWMKIITLMNMDNYMKDYYAKQRPPRGMLFINTSNMNSITKAWNWMLDQFKVNPHQIPPLIIESPDGKTNNVQFIDLMKSLDEMQFTQVRDEFSKKIGACYGCMPLFQGDISSSGGLNNEGLQITVTDRTVLDGQKLFNNKFFKFITEQLNITDYEVILKPNQEENTMKKEELMSKKINNARIMQEMGFKITLTEKEEFEYGPKNEAIQKPQMGGFPQLSNMNNEQNNTINETENTNNEPINEIGTFKNQNNTEKNNQYELKSDSMVTTNTEGINNPIHQERKKKIQNLIFKISEEMQKNENISYDINKDDKIEQISDFIQKGLYNKKFDGINKSTSDLIKDYILKSIIEGKDLNSVVKYIMNKGKTDKQQAETIASTERQSLINKTREYIYNQSDPEGETRYKWLNPLDKRTSKICKNITENSKQGLTLNELKELIKQEANNNGMKDPREWTPHPNCRSVMVRTIQ